MHQVLFYSIFLTIGLLLSQNLQEITSLFSPTAGKNIELFFREGNIFYSFLMICLSYIMIEVGIEFTFSKEHKNEYIKDYFVASMTAAFPWIFCTVYFTFVCHSPFLDALLLSRFASPTSSGILFPMLASMGLTKSWFYQKARLHTILDDLDSALFMIPLQIALIGYNFAFFLAVLLICLLLCITYRLIHSIHLPTNGLAIFIYSIFVWFFSMTLNSWDIHMETLLPAFCLGCMIKKPKNHEDFITHKESYSQFTVDKFVKYIFMFTAGLSLPQIHLQELYRWDILFHVLSITLLMNMGKCLPLFFYRKEADLRERMALCIAMFPRGEIGAGILAISFAHGGNSHIGQIASLALALNLLMTGFFISMIHILCRKKMHKFPHLPVRTP